MSRYRSIDVNAELITKKLWFAFVLAVMLAVQFRLAFLSLGRGYGLDAF